MNQFEPMSNFFHTQDQTRFARKIDPSNPMDQFSRSHQSLFFTTTAPASDLVSVFTTMTRWMNQS
jgi:hypothetical protein